MNPLFLAASLLLLFLLSGFFSGSETALMSLSRIRVRNMVDTGVPRAETVQRLLADPGRLLSVLLIGNNIVNIVTSSIATVLFISLLGPRGIPVAMAVTTVIILIFGEIIPKTWANHNSERWALRVAFLIKQLMFLLSPLITVFAWIANQVLRAVGGAPKRTSLVTEDEIKTVINLGQTEGVLGSEEKEMLNSVLEFGDTRVREVLVPRRQVFALEESLSIEEAAIVAVEAKYSRIPVYSGSVDQIQGLVHTKDLLEGLMTNPKAQLQSIMRPVMFVPEALVVGKLLKRMQREKASIAVVLDEYGATSGLVTIEDIVEEIVGEITDEYDNPQNMIQPVDEWVTLIDGGLAIEEVNEELGSSFPSTQAHSIGGLVFFQLGRIPQVGDTLEFGEWELTVEEAQGRRATKVKIKKN